MSALGEERTVPHASSNLRNLRNLQSQIRDLGLRAPFAGARPDSSILRITAISHATPAEPGSEPPYSQTRHFSGRFSLLGKVSAESSIVVTTDFHSPTIL